MSTGKRGGVKKRLGTATKASRGTRGQPVSKHSLGSHSAEERAVMDRGLRILARMLARAHLQRHGISASGETDAAHEVPDSPVEGAFTPEVDITGTG